MTKKAERLLREQFTRNGKVFCSGTHTCDGTMRLWGQIVKAGLVTPMHSFLGHPFAFELTPQGRQYLL